MYFKKLEISGFKSFAEKTLLHFEPGITAVVGPNGCGKSNIFDAIRWCLGEQSIKSLRGAKSEDVIFNGTETAPAKNMAEVSLTISNEAKILPIDYEEVTITRRLFRSGDSEYLINNNLVRLRDINELLMGTGIGAESYSLVEQGKIDLVISSRPEDRRLVFDEATGVSKYKAKKKEAMKKLEETDQNLLRVNDIIAEVKRQIASIERQASKARRYKEVFDQLKDAELKLANIELNAVRSELAMLNELIKSSQTDETALNGQLKTLDEKVIHQQRQLQDLDNRLTELKETISSLENLNLRNHQHIHLNQDRIHDLNQHASVLSNQKEQLKTKISIHEKSIAELTSQLASHREIFNVKEEDFKLKDATLNGLSSDIEGAQQENKNLKNRIFDLNVGETKARNLLTENTSSMHTLISRQRRLEIEKIKTEEENGEILKNLATVNGAISQEKETIEKASQDLGILKNKKSDLESGMKRLEAEIRDLENEKLKLRSQIDFLKELKLKYDSMPEAKTGFFEISELPQGTISGIIAHAKEISFQENTKMYRITCELKFISFDLENLEARITEIAGRIEQMIREMSGKEKNLLVVLEGLEAAENQLQQEKYNLTNKEAVQTNLSDNARRLHDELSVITLELQEVNENLALAREKDTSCQEELQKIESDITACENTINQNTTLLAQKGRERETLLVDISALKTEIANQKNQEEALQGNLLFFKNALAQDNEAWNINHKEIESSQGKVKELTREMDSLESEIKSNEEEIENKSKEHQAESQIRVEELNTMDFVQKQIIDLEEKIDKVKEEHHHNQMQEQELNFRYSNTKNRILQSYNIDLEENPLPGEILDAVDAQATGAQIALLREKVESFGTVNLVAIEELEELKNRYDFLTQQNNDLVMAKETLQTTIQKINRNTRKMFLETFQMVAEEFKNYYRLLFGGGEARLYLLDEDDVLESGIEIICRPPGKKLQNITLLSGGEKALSAIALIFAIFKTKPSPFCVLDEIDAALDESNIDRFSRMLSDFAKTSQFITITHNKKTISRANVMYGITMEHSGISKIVSVKLHESDHRRASVVIEEPKKDTPQVEKMAEQPTEPLLKEELSSE
jgi:chromosome segregation protein